MTSNSFESTVGSVLLEKEPLPEDASHLVPDKLTHRWENYCDGCEQSINGKRYTCDKEDYDLCGDCISQAHELHPEHILRSVPIPEQEPIATTKQVATNEVLDGKHVVLYFGALWCGVCRPFLETLMVYYTAMQEKKVPFEVVYVSEDYDLSSFARYFNEMPWLAIPYSEETELLRSKLKEQYKAEGVPSAVLLDPQGNCIDEDARFLIEADPYALRFPYKPLTLHEILAGPFVRPDGSKLDQSELAGKYLALYFDAEWRQDFALEDARPVIARAHEAANAEGHPFEVLFISEDYEEDSIVSFSKMMPWATHELADCQYMCHWLQKMFAKASDSDYFSMSSQVVILDPQLELINNDAFVNITLDPTAENFPWAPRLVNDIRLSVQTRSGHLYSTPSLVAFCRGVPEDEQDAINSALDRVAEKWTTEETKTAFFTARTRGDKSWNDMAWYIQKQADAKALDGVFAVMIDATKKECHVHEGEINEDAFNHIVSQYWANTLEMKEIIKAEYDDN